MQKPNRLSKNNKGVTLVEVIAVIAVLSVVMGAITGFMITGARMSAQVSGGATAGMREQTAAEYINQRLWEAAGIIKESDPVEGSDEDYRTLEIGEAKLTTREGKVMYIMYNSVELCQGEIYFKRVDNDTVTYVLNGVTHIVHLRMEQPETSQP